MPKTQAEIEAIDALGDFMGEQAPGVMIDNLPLAPGVNPESLTPGVDLAAPPKAEELEADADKPGTPVGDQEAVDADKPKPGEDEVVDDEPTEADALAELSSPLKHEDVQESQAFKGVLGDLTKARTKQQATQTELDTANQRIAELTAEVPAATGDQSDDDDPSEDDDEVTIFTKKELRAEAAKVAKAAVAEALVPYAARAQTDDATTHQTNLADEITTMKADPNIPDALKLGAICQSVRKSLAKTDPDYLKTIEGKPGMARKLFSYGNANMPEIQAMVTKARSTQNADETQRAVTGQSDTENAAEWFDLANAAEELIEA